MNERRFRCRHVVRSTADLRPEEIRFRLAMAFAATAILAAALAILVAALATVVSRF